MATRPIAETSTQTRTKFEQVPIAIAKKIARAELKRPAISKRRVKIKSARVRTGGRK